MLCFILFNSLCIYYYSSSLPSKNSFHSIAKSLGSLTISPQTLQYYREASPPIISYVTTDADAVNACAQLSGR